MARFAEWMTDEQILATLSQTLSWSHIVELLPIKDPLARDFYAEMCRIERWDVRTLRQKIACMLFQRTALSKRPTSLISAEISKLRDGQMSPDTVFRDPYGSTSATRTAMWPPRGDVIGMPAASAFPAVQVDPAHTPAPDPELALQLFKPRRQLRPGHAGNARARQHRAGPSTAPLAPDRCPAATGAAQRCVAT